MRLFEWRMPNPLSPLTRKQRAFLTHHDIHISNAYIGMLRAYHDNHTVWQTSAWVPIMAAMNRQLDGGRMPLDEIEQENDTQLRAWVEELMGLSDADLAKRFAIDIHLLS